MSSLRGNVWPSVLCTSMLAVLLFRTTANGEDATPSAMEASAPPRDMSAALSDLLPYCYQTAGLDTAQLKVRADSCKPILDSLKSGLDAEGGLQKLRIDAADNARTARQSDDQRTWGQTWNHALWIGDGIVALITLFVVIGVLRSPQPTSLLREEGTGVAAGKVSFGRVLGLIGGLAALVYIGLITNVCLSFLFVTGKMPDQLGPVYATAVGTFFAAIIPYLIGKLKS